MLILQVWGTTLWLTRAAFSTSWAGAGSAKSRLGRTSPRVYQKGKVNITQRPTHIHIQHFNNSNDHPSIFAAPTYCFSCWSNSTLTFAHPRWVSGDSSPLSHPTWQQPRLPNMLLSLDTEASTGGYQSDMRQSVGIVTRKLVALLNSEADGNFIMWLGNKKSICMHREKQDWGGEGEPPGFRAVLQPLAPVGDWGLAASLPRGLFHSQPRTPIFY